MVSEEQNSDMELASEIVPVPQIQPEIEVTEEEQNATNQGTNDIPHRHPRQRKKALHAAIIKQMEFYFSDANLNKDRFLGGLVKDNPDVNLDIFLSFNKIRTLTTDKKRLAKALRHSKMLQISEDGEKVRRITPIMEKQNVEECTIYVQRLPSDADHEWLSELFSEYGPVAYVSIPKFKYNNKIKGFAFVEFETPEGAEKCLKAFRKKGCELPSQTSPSEVLSITTFNEPETQKDSEKSEGKKTDKNLNENAEKSTEKSFESEKPNKRKGRKRSLRSEDPGDSGTDQQSDVSKPKKKYDGDTTNKELNAYLSDSNTAEEKRAKKRKNRHSLEQAQDSDIDTHKSSKDDDKKQKKVKTEVTEEKLVLEKSSYSSLCPDSNTESEEKHFKKRKNKYSLEEVRNSDNELSKNSRESDKKHKKLKVEISEEEAESKDCMNQEIEKDIEKNIAEKKKKLKRKRKRHNSTEQIQTVNMGLQIMAKKDWKKLRNKYLDLQRAKMKQLKQHITKARWNQWSDKNKIDPEHEEISDKKENLASNLEFTPGVIVKFELNEACVDPKSFKTELKSKNANIKYIDIKEGSNEGFIRCDSSEAAVALAEKTDNERHYKVLVDEEERVYWEKIKKDRKEKISNKIRVKQRGRDKLLKKAEKELGKHIKFDEV